MYSNCLHTVGLMYAFINNVKRYSREAYNQADHIQWAEYVSAIHYSQVERKCFLHSKIQRTGYSALQIIDRRFKNVLTYSN